MSYYDPRDNDPFKPEIDWWKTIFSMLCAYVIGHFIRKFW